MTDPHPARKQRIAKLVASAIDEGVWFDVSTTKKLGVALFALGWLGCPFAFLNLAPGPLFWGLGSIAFIAVGAGLAYAGTAHRSFTADGPDNISNVPHLPSADGSADGGTN